MGEGLGVVREDWRGPRREYIGKCGESGED